MQVKLPAAKEQKLISILQKCRYKKDSHCAKRLYAYMCNHHLELHPLLGNYLIPMLAESGSLSDARHVFDRLPLQNEHSWTSLISGYLHSGEPLHALHLYQKMRDRDDVRPNLFTYLVVLNACARLKDEAMGQGIHAEITKEGLGSYIFAGSAVVGNTLVDMYGKCGLHAEACQVFDELLVQNEISWNALIAGYAEHKLALEAANCFQQMQLELIAPDSVTFLSCLRACGNKQNIVIGRGFHAEILKRGLERGVSLGNTLVDMYAKCSSLVEARQVFDGLPAQDIVSWNALISGYAEHGLDDDAIHFLQEMQTQGVSVDAVTYVCILKKSSGSITSLERGRELHMEITRRGLEKEVYVGTILVDMYTKCSSLAEAHRVFDWLPAKNVVSWNALISGYSEHKLSEQVLHCFEQMQLGAVSPDSVTFVLCLKACGTLGALQTGRDIHALIRKSRLETDRSVGSMLVDMYGKCGAVAEGREVFDSLPVQDVVTWTAMIKAYGENHEGDNAVQCFEKMQEQGVKPDSITFACVLAACSHASLILKGQEYFKIMKEKHGIKPMLDHYACMIDLFGRSGHVQEAERVIAAMQYFPSTESLLALLTASKIYGKLELGHKCFQLLVEANQEDAAAYLLLQDLYADAGKWDDADKVDHLRRHTTLNKMPGSTVIEVNKTLHEFMVDVNQRQGISKMFYIIRLHMNEEGYVPNVNLISRHSHSENNGAFLTPIKLQINQFTGF